MAVLKKPANRLENIVIEENPSLVVEASCLEQAPASPVKQKKAANASPFSIGFRPLKFIRKKCLDFPFFEKPVFNAKRIVNKESSKFAETRPTTVEQKQALVEPLPAFVEPLPISFEQHPIPVDPHPIREVSTARPMDQEKMGYVSPSYSMSRSVSLNPQVMLANRCVGYQQDSPELEFYKVLRTQILQRSKSGGNTVMVTSALPGEGKTLTAINLAFTFAKEFKQTALLVDCDLKRQQIHKVLGFPSERGLADYLVDDCLSQDLFVWPGVEKLSIISGGKTATDSSELLGSPGMINLVAEMKNRYPERYIFFDVPPLLTSADSLAFAPLVDYILVTVQAGQTPLQDVNKALGLLPSEKVLGLVMNRQKT